MPQRCDKCGVRKVRHTKRTGPARIGPARVNGSLAPCNGPAERYCRKCKPEEKRDG
jgi:hypothetical protein